MIKEHDPVALIIDLPELELRSGDVGVVIDITGSGKEFTLEFFTSGGESFAIATVSGGSIRALDDSDRVIERVIRSA